MTLDGDSRRLIGRLWRDWIWPHWHELLFAGVLMVLVAATTALYPVLIKWTFQWYEARNQPTIDVLGWAIPRGDIVFLLPPLILAVTVAKGASLYFQTVSTSRVVFKIVTDLQRAMFAHLITADLARLSRDTTGSLISRFVNDMSVISEALSRAINNLVRDVLTVVSLVAAMIYLDWMLTLMVLVLYPIVAVPIANLGKRLRKLSANMQSHMGDMTAVLSESLSGARMVKTYGLEPYETERAAKTFRRQFTLMMTQVKNRAWLEPMLEVVAGLAVAGVLVFAGWRIMSPGSTKSIGDFTGFITALMRFPWCGSTTSVRSRRAARRPCRSSPRRTP